MFLPATSSRLVGLFSGAAREATLFSVSFKAGSITVTIICIAIVTIGFSVSLCVDFYDIAQCK